MSDIENTELLKENEQFYTTFEPKTVNRFLVKLTDKEGKTLIPCWLIKSITRPKVQRSIAFGTWTWLPIVIRVYDPIVPSATQMFYEYLMEDEPPRFDITVDVLGPVGDTVEKWEIKNARFSQVNFGDMDWSGYPEDGKSKLEHQNFVRYYKGGNAMEITAVISYDVAELKF